MKSNKKILCVFIVLITLFAINSVSATEDTSDIVASDATVSEISLSQDIDESMGAGDTIVITNQTFSNYFTAEGELNNNVSAGSTLDFQGTFTGEAYKVNITKPVNIISSTEDALFNELGKTASSGGCFHISAGGSGTNVSDVNFVNTPFYVTGASDVSIENINMMADKSGIGSGTGFMCIQAGSRYVTVKDSYFENRGTGSSILVIGYSDYCTVEGNEIFINGSSGNALYITTYVPAKYSGTEPTGNVILNNYIHGKYSDYCQALVVAGNDNLIEGNVIEYNGAGITGQSFTTQYNNTYIENFLTGECSFTAGENSYVSGNIVEGTLTAGSNSIVEDNEMESLSLSKPNVVVDNNVINGDGVTLNAAALNTTLTNNIIYSPVTVKSKNNTIQKNIVDADSEYAIDLTTSTGNEVSDNKLVSNNFTGDAAVKAGENNTVHDNGAMENIVTPENFFYFFDTNGHYRGLNFTELYFKGEFDNLVDTIIIDQDSLINSTLTISSLDATLNDMAFFILTDNVTIDGFKMTFDAAPLITDGSAILINHASNITIKNMDIDYVLNESNYAYVINAFDTDGLTIKDSAFLLDSKTNGDDINNIIHVATSSDVLIDNNDIGGTLPSCYVDWKEIPPASGVWVKFPVSQGVVLDACSNLTVSNNTIEVNYYDVVGDADTLYVVDITDSENVEFIGNDIFAIGHSYIYGLYVEADGLLIDDNYFEIESDENYANAIEIEASLNAVVSNNYIEVTSPVVAYGIYSGMNGGDLEVEYINNRISATSDIVYGMELCGTAENVQSNIITVIGNKTTGIAAKSEDINIFNNEINALGENLGNSTTTDLFEPMTAAINLINSIADIGFNTIVSSSRGILAENGFVTIRFNEINVVDNGLDDSYGIFAEGTDIGIFDNNITYVGNTMGDTINNAVNLENCVSPFVTDNDFDITIPSCYVDWKEVPPGSGNWVKFPISEGLVFTNCSDLSLKENDVSVEVNSIVGVSDTIYCIDIKDSENVNVADNFVRGTGFSYIYGLYIEADDSAVDNNTFIIESENFANGIEIEESINTVVQNNDISVTSPVVAYGIYSGMNGGDLEVEYYKNTISACADIVYGMELCGTEENLQSNLITVIGNKTTGIAANSKRINIYINEINALGENLGNSTTVEIFEPMTAAIHLINSVADIERNTIISNSKGIVAENGFAAIQLNEINVVDNGLDDSYGIFAEGTDIGIFENNITYVGNTAGETINNAVYLKDCTEPVIQENEFDITLPSCYVDWKEIPPGSGNWVGVVLSEGIVVDSEELVMDDNHIVLNYDGVVGDYDTIYVVDIKSNNSDIFSNTIEANGHSYIYGLVISGEYFTVANNTILVMSDDFYANGINVEGYAIGIVTDNVIANQASGVVYPIYSGMSNGDVSVDYLNNTIIAVADTPYAMELDGLEENVEGNNILVMGNTSTGIYSLCSDLTVKNNTIRVLSNNSASTAFKGRLGNATITDNTIDVEGEYTVDVTIINALVKDNHLVANELTGDASVNYDPETSSVYNNTPKMDKLFLTSEGLEKYFGNTKPLEFLLTDAAGNPISNKSITITLNGQNYTRTTDANGTARLNINLNSGDYTATGTYTGEGYNLTQDVEITILSTIESNDITKVFKNDTQYYATFVDTDGNLLKNTDVEFNINGVMYTRKTNENGTAKLNINLNPGEYIITAINPNTKERAANNVTVLSSIVDNSDLTKYYKNASQYVVKIIDASGNPVGAGENVTFNINGVFYTRQTNESGEAKLNINLEPGQYIITADYNGCKVSNNIKVLPTLITKDLPMKYKDGSTFNATVLDGQGNPLAEQKVGFNINGVFYYRTSGSDGIAKLNINLMPGDYVITSIYDGYSVGNKVTISS